MTEDEVKRRALPTLCGPHARPEAFYAGRRCEQRPVLDGAFLLRVSFSIHDRPRPPYSTREFFRQMPNALLARYFHAHDLFHDLDFAAMRETKPDALFTAWLELPDGQAGSCVPFSVDNGT